MQRNSDLAPHDIHPLGSRNRLVRMGDGEGTENSMADRETVVEDGLMTVNEAASFLRVSRSSLYTMMDAGELAFVKLGRSRRIPRRAVIELAARSLQGGRKAP